MTLYNHPDYLVMGMIVNGVDNVDMNVDDFVLLSTGLPRDELSAMAQDEVFSVVMACQEEAAKRGIELQAEAVRSSAWAVGFHAGLRLSRHIQSSDMQAVRASLDSVDKDSVSTMAVGRARLFEQYAPGDSTETLQTLWTDGVIIGSHFDAAN